jgi:hypothetical protein
MTQEEQTKYTDLIFTELRGLLPKDMLTILAGAYIKTAKTTISMSKIVGVETGYKAGILKQLERVRKSIENSDEHTNE